MRRASRSASVCRRSRRPSVSGSASSSSRAKVCRTRCSSTWRTRLRPPSMKILASPASLKGVLTPGEAAALLVAGMGRVDGIEAFEAPVADGGEGTADVIYAALGGEWRTAVVSDPFGRSVGARWLLLDDGTAVVEAAAALGLPLIAPNERDPLRASSRGFGEL